MRLKTHRLFAISILLAFSTVEGSLFAERPAQGLGYQTFESQSSLYGEILVARLSSSPFPHAERQGGYRNEEGYFPYDPHYSDATTTVFVPRGFSPGNGPVDLVFFFHGWYTSVDQSARAFSLFRQFSESGINALLVMPEAARYAPDSFGGKLEETNGFRRFTNELLTVLAERNIIKTPTPGNIVLSAHSGGYRIVSAVLARGGLGDHIREIYLFDALFAGMNRFTDWIRNTGGRFVSVYLANGETKQNNEDLIASLRKTSSRVIVADDDPDRDFLQLYSRIVFLKNSVDHYSLVCSKDEFRRILSTSVILGHY